MGNARNINFLAFFLTLTMLLDETHVHLTTLYKIHL